MSLGYTQDVQHIKTWNECFLDLTIAGQELQLSTPGRCPFWRQIEDIRRNPVFAFDGIVVDAQEVTWSEPRGLAVHVSNVGIADQFPRKGKKRFRVKKSGEELQLRHAGATLALFVRNSDVLIDVLKLGAAFVLRGQQQLAQHQLIHSQHGLTVNFVQQFAAIEDQFPLLARKQSIAKRIDFFELQQGRHLNAA